MLKLVVIDAFDVDQVRDVIGAHVNPAAVVFDIEVDSEAVDGTDARRLALLQRIGRCHVYAAERVLCERLREDILAFCGHGDEIIVEQSWAIWLV